MINVSNESKSRIEDGIFLTYLTITLQDGTVLDVTDEDIWDGGFKITEGISESGQFSIGSCIVNKLTVILDDTEEKYSQYVFDYAQAIAYLGIELPDGTVEKIKKGVYTVDETSCDGEIITLECLDNMHKLDQEYAKVKTSYPATIGKIVRDICTVCGVALQSASFEGYNISIDRSPGTDNITCRQVLSYAMQRICKFARFNKDGALTVGWFDQKAFENEVLLDGGVFDSDTPYSSGTSADGGNFDPWNTGYEFDSGNFTDQQNFHHFYSIDTLDAAIDDVIISGVEVTAESEEGEKTPILYGNTGYVLKILNNPFIHTQSQAEIAAKYIGSRLVGLKFRPLEANVSADPTVEAGDIAFISDGSQKTYAMPVTNLTFDADDNMQISCDAETTRKNGSGKLTELEQAIVKMRKETQFSLSAYDSIVRQMNQLAANTFGFYETVIKQDDGSVICYRHDKPKLEQSKTVWKSGIDGFFVTQNYTGKDSTTTWRAGFDSSGNAVLNMLAVIGIHWDWATGGTLTLGGQGNGNGIMKVLDSSGRLVVSIDSSGYNLYNQSGQIIASNDKRGYIVYSQPLDMSNGSHTYKGLLYYGDGIRRVSGTYDMSDAIVEYIDITAMDDMPISYDSEDHVTVQGTNVIATNTYTDNINPNGDELNIGGGTHIAGNAIVDGGTTVDGDAGITGNATVGGNATVTGTVNAGGDIKTNKYLKSSGLEVGAAAYAKYYRLRSDIGSGSGGHNVGIKAHTTGSGDFVTTDYWYFYKVSSSSKRYKDIGEIISEDDIENWYNIQPLWAKYKDGYLIEGDENEGRYLPMFVAEDVEKYLPEAVTHENGQVEDWNYRVMIPAMFAMIKKQHEEIQELKQMIGGSYGSKDQDRTV